MTRSVQIVGLNARTPDGQRALRLWHDYMSSRRREQMRLAAGGIVWAGLWSVMAFSAYRSEEENTGIFIGLALSGWLAIFPAVRGTGFGLALRFLVLAVTVAFARSTAWPFSAPGWLAAAVMVAGVVADLRSQTVPLHAVRRREDVCFLAPDERAFLWLVARRIPSAVVRSEAAAAALLRQLSPLDAATVEVLCALCGTSRTIGVSGRRQCACVEKNLILVSSEGGDARRKASDRVVSEAARRVPRRRRNPADAARNVVNRR